MKPTIGWVSNQGLHTTFEVETVYDVLSTIEEKPGLFLGGRSLRALQHFVTGFRMGLLSMNIELADGTPPFSEFHRWTSAHVAPALAVSAWDDLLAGCNQDDEKAYALFFVELAKFRAA